MTQEAFSVALVGRLKHGRIVEALHRRGWTQNDLARAMKTSPTDIGRIINMQAAPSRRWLTPEREKVLLDLTGQLPDDLWPDWARSEDWLEKDKRIVSVRDVPLAVLLGRGVEGLLGSGDTDDPETQLLVREHQAVVADVVRSLTPREEKVIRLRFGLGGEEELTLDEIAARFGKHKETIRQIQAKALRKLRHPSRACRLRRNTVRHRCNWCQAVDSHPVHLWMRCRDVTTTLLVWLHSWCADAAADGRYVPVD